MEPLYEEQGECRFWPPASYLLMTRIVQQKSMVDPRLQSVPLQEHMSAWDFAPVHREWGCYQFVPRNKERLQ